MSYEEALKILIAFSESITDGSWLFLPEETIDKIQQAMYLVDNS